MKDTRVITTRKFLPSLILTLLAVLLLSPLYAAKIPCIWTGVEKVIAVGDIHGDYNNFVKILKAVDIVDEQLHWKGQKTHFVQTGDIMDRGPDAKKAFDLLMRLEKEAEKAGGKVHVLIGNHEEMNITGISFDYPGYVTVEQFVSFLPEQYRRKKEKEFNKNSKEVSGNLDLSLNPPLRKFWEDILKKDLGARKTYVIHFNDTYGKWLLRHNAVIKINDTVFVHGGISRKYSTWKLEDVNNLLRKELTYYRRAAVSPLPPKIPFRPQIVFKSDGPLWYRGLALPEEGSFEQEVDEILHNLDAKHMVIAHTTQAGNPSVQAGSPFIGKNYISRFDEKIWIIDTGISELYGGFLSALIIEKGKFRLWGIAHE
ncbi:MAG: metallophosphoesterase [Candidatus Aminicenantales bacterium]